MWLFDEGTTRRQELRLREIELLLAEYRIVVETQQHFNDLLMRIRTNGLTVVLAVFGAAAFSLRFRIFFFRIPCTHTRVHVAVAIILFGRGGWSSIRTQTGRRSKVFA